jgi:hypothetical protein
MVGHHNVRECVRNDVGLLRTTNDEDIPMKHITSTKNQDQIVPSNTNQGTLTRSHAKKLQQQVTSLLAELDNNISENVILPKSFMLKILRLKHQGEENPQVEQERD